MPKKLIFATLLLLLVGAQTLAASCDLRCALATSTGCHSGHQAVSSKQCHMTMAGHTRGVSITKQNSCTVAACRQQFDATIKASEPDRPTELLHAGATATLPLYAAALFAGAASHSIEPNRWERGETSPHPSLAVLRL